MSAVASLPDSPDVRMRAGERIAGSSRSSLVGCDVTFYGITPSSQIAETRGAEPRSGNTQRRVSVKVFCEMRKDNVVSYDVGPAQYRKSAPFRLSGEVQDRPAITLNGFQVRGLNLDV